MTTPTEPKLGDPIVFNYMGSHIKLTPNRATTTGTTKVLLTWRAAEIDENRFGDLTYTRKQNNNAATTAEPKVIFNKAGLY